MGLAIKPTAQTMFFSLYNCTLRAPLVSTKLRLSIWSWAPALRAQDLYYQVAIFQPELVLRAPDLRYTAAIVQLELKTCTLRTRLVLQSCDFRAELKTCTSRTILALQSCELRQSWKLVLHVLYLRYKAVTFQLVLETCTLRGLDLYFKVAILQLELVLRSCIFQLELETCTSRTRLALQSRDFPARPRALYFAY